MRLISMLNLLYLLMILICLPLGLIHSVFFNSIDHTLTLINIIKFDLLIVYIPVFDILQRLVND